MSGESHDTTVRVRYAETDRMGLLHHANYFVYFELSRTEMLRARGITYREVEDAGHLLVIIDLGCKYKKPAYYDDLLTIRTTIERIIRTLFNSRAFWAVEVGGGAD